MRRQFDLPRRQWLPRTASRLSAPTVRRVRDAYEMLGVSCVSAAHCVAVGYGAGSKVKGGVVVPITERRAREALDRLGSDVGFLGVSCVTATKCVVAGQATPTVASAAELWLWHGGKLSLIKQTTSTSETSSTFRGIDCWSASRCTASRLRLRVATSRPRCLARSHSPRTRATMSSLDNVAGYGAAVACPTSRVCYVGGATARRGR